MRDSIIIDALLAALVVELDNGVTPEQVRSFDRDIPEKFPRPSPLFTSNHPSITEASLNTAYMLNAFNEYKKARTYSF